MVPSRPAAGSSAVGTPTTPTRTSRRAWAAAKPGNTAKKPTAASENKASLRDHIASFIRWNSWTNLSVSQMSVVKSIRVQNLLIYGRVADGVAVGAKGVGRWPKTLQIQGVERRERASFP